MLCSKPRSGFERHETGSIGSLQHDRRRIWALDISFNVQGFRSGCVCAKPLAAAALRLAGPLRRCGWTSETQKGNPITALLEHTSQVFDDQCGMVETNLLLAGAADGSLQAVDILTGRLSFLLHLHTAEVRMYLLLGLMKSH